MMAIEDNGLFGQFGHECEPQEMDNVSAGEDITIHSGHFMLSRVHDNTVQSDEEDDDESACVIDLTVSPETGEKGFDFITANKETSKTYRFGPRCTQFLAIDASLSKLFECMTLAYSGKLSSPKWKPFRGMHLKSKDKVRLNNIIWREWHMQYIYGKNPIVCQFATPLSEDIHTKPESIVLEGKYWKRRLDTVTAEYKRWRKYHKARVTRNHSGADVEMQEDSLHSELLMKLKDVTSLPPTRLLSATDILINSTDINDMDFSSVDFFSCLNQPFAFPVPRELSGYGYADLIQPGLVQLQPPLDDFMDTLDPLHEMIASTKALSNNYVSQSSQNKATLSNSNQNSAVLTIPDVGHTNHKQHQELPRRASADAVLTSPIALADLFANSTALSNLTGLFQVSTPTDASAFVPDSQITDNNIDQLLISQIQQQLQPVRSTLPATVDKPAVPRQTVIGHSKAKPLNSRSHSVGNAPSLLMGGQSMSPLKTVAQTKSVPNFTNRNEQTLLGQDRNISNSSRLSARPSSNPSTSVSTTCSELPLHSALQSALATHLKQTSQKTGTDSINLTGKTSPLRSQPLPHVSHATKKPTQPVTPQRDGFVVPTGKPVLSRIKQRTIAPAPAPASSQLSNVAKPATSSAAHQNTYLAQLLTTGTYPGAIINVKKEPAPSSCSVAVTPTTFTPIRPAETPPQTTSILPTSVPSAMSIVNLQQVTNFPTSVLLAAANHALGSTTVSVKDVLSMANISSNSAAPIHQAIIASSSKLESPSVSDSTPLFVCSQITEPGSPTDSLSFLSQAGSPSGSEASGISRKFESERGPNKEHRRVSHISAEQKRRCNIKSGFDTLHCLIPSLSQNPNAKISKAAMLQKTAEYCKKLKNERAQMQNEAEILKQEIESLNTAITLCQSQLPATGVPITRQRADQMKEMFEDYVKKRTLSNWKFWIFSIIIRNLFDSFNNMVSTASVDELCRTVLAWLDQHCSLVALRPTVLNALRHLSTTTSILSDPARVPEQAAQAVIKGQSSSNKS